MGLPQSETDASILTHSMLSTKSNILLQVNILRQSPQRVCKQLVLIKKIMQYLKAGSIR